MFTSFILSLPSCLLAFYPKIYLIPWFIPKQFLSILCFFICQVCSSFIGLNWASFFFSIFVHPISIRDFAFFCVWTNVNISLAQFAQLFSLAKTLQRSLFGTNSPVANWCIFVLNLMSINGGLLLPWALCRFIYRVRVRTVRPWQCSSRPNAFRIPF